MILLCYRSEPYKGDEDDYPGTYSRYRLFKGHYEDLLAWEKDHNESYYNNKDIYLIGADDNYVGSLNELINAIKDEEYPHIHIKGVVKYLESLKEPEDKQDSYYTKERMTPEYTPPKIEKKLQSNSKSEHSWDNSFKAMSLSDSNSSTSNPSKFSSSSNPFSKNLKLKLELPVSRKGNVELQNNYKNSQSNSKSNYKWDDLSSSSSSYSSSSPSSYSSSSPSSSPSSYSSSSPSSSPPVRLSISKKLNPPLQPRTTLIKEQLRRSTKKQPIPGVLRKSRHKPSSRNNRDKDVRTEFLS